MNQEPTREQIKEFWEWCGLSQNRWTLQWFVDSNTKADPQPTLDLNNLFKYAVPKLQKEFFKIDLQNDRETGKWQTYIYRPYGNLWEAVDKDPTLALFWAIWEVIHE